MDGSEIRSTDCFCRGSGFNSQYPHALSQWSVTSVPRDFMPYFDLRGYQACKCCKDIHESKTTHTHKGVWLQQIILQTMGYTCVITNTSQEIACSPCIFSSIHLPCIFYLEVFLWLLQQHPTSQSTKEPPQSSNDGRQLVCEFPAPTLPC